MNSLQNPASRISSISASSSSRRKFQNETKMQDPRAMIISAATPSLCIASIPMVTGHYRTGRRILDHIHRKETHGPSIKDSPHTANRAELQIMAAVMAEAHTQQNPRTACTTIVKPTTAPKIAPFSLKPSGIWSKNPLNLGTNHHPEK
jgi:hypothetical protein